MNRSVRPKANPNIVLREEFERKVFLYDPDTGDTFDINPVGAFVWECLGGAHTLDQIREQLNSKFEPIPASVSRDIESFLNDLKERGFIE